VTPGGEESSLAGREGDHGGSMAGKEQSLPELVETALGSSVFDGKSSGSKKGPSRTHLGGYRSSGRSQERRTLKTVDGSFPEHFDDLRRVV